MRTGAYFASSSYSYPIIDQLLNEMITIARAKNINVPADLGDQLIQKCRDLQLHNPAGITTSMMLDNLAGRDMEVECILGAPLREAQLHEIKTPTLLT
jgi:ketopantoate reductase